MPYANELAEGFLDADEVVTNLSQLHISPETIAQTVNLPLADVKKIVARNRPQSIDITDEKIVDEMRMLAGKAIRQAHVILEFGTTADKMTIIKSMLSGLGRQISQTSGNETEETRTALEQVFAAMRTVKELVPFVEDANPLKYIPVEGHVTVTAPSLPADD